MSLTCAKRRKADLCLKWMSKQASEWRGDHMPDGSFRVLQSMGRNLGLF